MLRHWPVFFPEFRKQEDSWILEFSVLPEKYTPPIPEKIEHNRELAAQNRLGTKAGEGIYVYKKFTVFQKLNECNRRLIQLKRILNSSY